jgi:mannose-6-phosphate isomerase-like protein (cupin superfamily)
MKFISCDTLAVVPAGHENPLAPGVLKKVLLEKADLQAGRVQMVNWAILPAGNQFARHYHEDMQEVFVMIEGEAELTVASETVTMRRGDAVVIDAYEIHQMRNLTAKTVAYLALGISREAGGKTMVVE